MKNKKILGIMLIILLIASIISINFVIAEGTNVLTDDSALITSLVITNKITGLGNFDSTDDPGNDSSSSNNIVRTFDTVNYNLTTTMEVNTLMGSQDAQENVKFKGGIINIKAQIPVEAKDYLQWDLDNMIWARNSGEISEDGLTFTAQFQLDENDITIPGSQTINISIKVLNAKNGVSFTPVFTAWMQGNESDPNHESREAKTVTDNDPVTISSSPAYNIKLNRTAYIVNELSYDFGNGIQTGRKYGYTVDLQVVNNNLSVKKGLMGLEMCDGPFEFDISLEHISDNVNINSTYMPRLYKYFSNNDITCTENNGKVHVIIDGYSLNMNQVEEDTLTLATSSFEFFVPYVDGKDSTIFTVKDMNMKVKSLTGNYIMDDIGTNSAQKIKNDDINSFYHLRTRKGSYTKAVLARINEDGKNKLIIAEGDAYALPGETTTFVSRFQVKSDNDNSGIIFSLNQLCKFDDRAFEPNGNYTIGHLNCNNTIVNKKYNKMLYVAKPDGLGWQSETEMNKAVEKDLIYYSTLEQLKNDGKICVGVMFEFTVDEYGIVSGGRTDSVFELKVKEDAIVGEVYQVCNIVRGWTYDNRLDRNIYTWTKPENMKSALLPKENISLLDCDYVKTKYYESGGMVYPHENYSIGQSLLIIGAKASVNKLIDKLASGDPKRLYDISNLDNIVNYVITPKLEVGTNVDMTTDLTIIDTLPKGLKYVNNSSVIGGIFNQSTNIVDDGQAINLEQGYPLLNANGSTTLKWVIKNVKVNEEIPKIHFSAKIDFDIENNTILTSNVEIQTPLDKREIKYRQDSYDITVINLENTRLYKNVLTPIVERDETIKYNIEYINNTKSDITGLRLVDILPYNSDGRNTSFNGDYILEKIIVNSNNINTNTSTYYINDNGIRTSYAPIKDIYLSNWNIANTQDINLPATAIMITGSIPSKATINVEVWLKPANNKNNDVYGNSVSVVTNAVTNQINSVPVQATVISRNIGGTLWCDNNGDGIRQQGERLISNARVEIVDENGNIAKDIFENDIPAIYTSNEGKYLFEKLVKDKEYIVRIYSDLDNYSLTTKNATNSNYTNDSDAKLQIINNVRVAVIDNVILRGNSVSKENENLDIGIVPIINCTKNSIPVTTEQDITQVRANSTIEYTITVENMATNDNDKVLNIIVKDTIPKGLTLISNSITYQLANNESITLPDTNVVNNTIVWPEVALEKGVNVFKFKVKVNKLESNIDELIYSNCATINRNNAEIDRTNIVKHKQIRNNQGGGGGGTTPSKPVRNLEVKKWSNPSGGTNEDIVSVIENQEITYYIDIYNKGAKTTQDIIVTDNIPYGTTYVDNSIGVEKNVLSNLPSEAVVARNSNFDFELNGEQIKFTIKGLPNNGFVRLYFKVKAPSLAQNETIKVFSNKAVIYDKDKNKTINTNEVFHKVQKLSLLIEKTSNQANKTNVNTDDVIEYMIKVKNTTNQIQQNILIKDNIPKYTTYIQDSVAYKINGKEVTEIGVYDINNNCIVCKIEQLQPNDEAILIFKVRVNDILSGVSRIIKNVATINNEPTNIIEHYQNAIANIEFSKSSDKEGKVKKGDIITYYINIKGNGNCKYIENVNILDYIPQGSIYVKDSAVLTKNGEVIKNDIYDEKTNSIICNIAKLECNYQYVLEFKVKADGTKDEIINIAKVNGENTNDVINKLNTENIEEPKVPKTGDSGILRYIALLIISSISLHFGIKKYKNII